MATAGQAFTSPIGESLVFLQTAADTDGELLEMEVSFVPARAAPPEHYHPFQREHFEVLSGTLHARIGGTTTTYHAGDRFEVPAGVVHTMSNGGDEIMRMRWQVRPALRSEDFYEAIWELARDGKADERGKPPLLAFAVIALAHDREFRLARPPYPVQKVILGLLARLGKLMGY